MFLELAEFLRCPADHPETHCVVAPHTMAGRDVVSGVVGCPACRREYPIIEGVVRFGEPPEILASSPLPEPGVVQALLGIATPGGYVVLLGSAGELIGDIGELMAGVHMVAVNAPPSARQGPGTSRLVAHASVPLRSGMARGVVLGEELLTAPWPAEAARILLPGLRLVALGEMLALDDVAKLASENGLWVGKKARSET